MDMDSFALERKSSDAYKGIAKNIEIRHDTSNYKKERRSHDASRKKQKCIGLMENEMGWKKLANSAAVTLKTDAVKIQKGEYKNINSEFRKAKVVK